LKSCVAAGHREGQQYVRDQRCPRALVEGHGPARIASASRRAKPCE
jgi:hypothetical protein